MNPKPVLVIMVGAGCAFLLPLPPLDPPPAVPAAVAAAKPPAGRKPAALELSREKEQEPALGLTDITRMERAACLEALDRQLLRYRGSQPPLEQQEIIDALALRLFRENAVDGEPAFPGTRNLPAWLLQAAWLASAKEAAGVPETLRRALPIMPEGGIAGARIVKALAPVDAEASLAFEKSMPADWRKNLREARLEGLAGVNPLEAARQTKPNDGERANVILTGAREAPMEAAVQALLHYSGDLEAREKASALTMLQKRDPAALVRLVGALDDPGLTESLARLPGTQAPDDSPELSLADALAAARLDPKSNLLPVTTAIIKTAQQDADAAITAWAGLEDLTLRVQSSSRLVAALAQYHPAKALAFCEEHMPESSASSVNIWLATDAPAALRTILELPYSSVFRQGVVEQLKGNGRSSDGRPPLLGVSREDLLLAAQELPPELLRHILPDN